jgi:hypothetical protein
MATASRTSPLSCGFATPFDVRPPKDLDVTAVQPWASHSLFMPVSQTDEPGARVHGGIRDHPVRGARRKDDEQMSR